MGLDTDVRKIARAVVREELRQIGSALKEGKSLEDVADELADADHEGARVPAEQAARDAPIIGRPASSERADRQGRGAQDELLHTLLREVSALRDGSGAPRKYVTRTEAQRLIGCRRTKIAELCAKKVFDTYKEGKTRMISVASIERYIESRLNSARAIQEPSRRARKQEAGGQLGARDAGKLAAEIDALEVD